MDKNPHLLGEPDEFIEANLGLAHTVAWGFIKAARKNMNIKFEKDDFMSIAYLALVKAYQRFNPTGHQNPDGGQIKFSTFAIPTIRGEIMQQTRDKGYMIKNNRIDKTPIDVDSVDRPLAEGGNTTLGDIIETGSNNGEQIVIMDFLSQIGPRLRKIYGLRTIGYKQKEVAKIMGTSQVNIGRMETYLYESARQYGCGMDLKIRKRYRKQEIM